MPTLYIRDVPDDVAETLKQRAAADGQSLSAYVAGALLRLAERPTNAEVVERLRQVDRTLATASEEIVSTLHESRR